MTELLLLTPTAVLGFLLWRESRRSDRLQNVQVATIDEFNEQRRQEQARHDSEREGWTKERSQLLNRIQRPDMAVYENYEPSRLDQHVPFDDDDAFWDSRDETIGNGLGDR